MSGTPVEEALLRVPLLAGLGKRDLKALCRHMTERTFAAGSEVNLAGHGGVGFFVIAEGRATALVGDRAVRTLGPGDHFGEMALIDRGRRTADIVADTELRCYFMTAWSFRAFVRHHPDMSWALLETMVARLREAQAHTDVYGG